MRVQRLRQEKLGLLLKCFTEIQCLREALKEADSDFSSGPGNFANQRISRLVNDHPVSKINEDDEDSNDSIIKLTGRLEQVFESQRLVKNHVRHQENTSANKSRNGQNLDSKINTNCDFLQRSSRFHRISIPSPKFNMLQTSKCVSSPSSQGPSLLDEENDAEPSFDQLRAINNPPKGEETPFQSDPSTARALIPSDITVKMHHHKTNTGLTLKDLLRERESPKKESELCEAPFDEELQGNEDMWKSSWRIGDDEEITKAQQFQFAHFLEPS